MIASSPVPTLNSPPAHVLMYSLSVLDRAIFTRKLVEKNCWWLKLCFLVETLNLSSIPGYALNETAESRDYLRVKRAANSKTDL